MVWCTEISSSVDFGHFRHGHFGGNWPFSSMSPIQVTSEKRSFYNIVRNSVSLLRDLTLTPYQCHIIMSGLFYSCTTARNYSSLMNWLCYMTHQSTHPRGPGMKIQQRVLKCLPALPPSKWMFRNRYDIRHRTGRIALSPYLWCFTNQRGERVDELLSFIPGNKYLLLLDMQNLSTKTTSI